jgi:hypothetical protein
VIRRQAALDLSKTSGLTGKSKPATKHDDEKRRSCGKVSDKGLQYDKTGKEGDAPARLVRSLLPWSVKRGALFATAEEVDHEMAD